MKLIIDIPEEEYKMRLLWAKSDNLCSPDTMWIARGVPYKERPQGKWIKITNDGIMPIEYMCNNCGRTVKSYNEEYWIEKVYPFCHCGADMRGDEVK